MSRKTTDANYIAMLTISGENVLKRLNGQIVKRLRTKSTQLEGLGLNR